MNHFVLFYWSVMGLVFYLQPTSNSHAYWSKTQEFFLFLACMLIGGVAMPAKFIYKVTK